MAFQHAGFPTTAAAALAPTPETLSQPTQPSPKNKKMQRERELCQIYPL